MNPSPWLPSLVKTQPDLFRAIYDWNAYPHRWALPAWLETIAVPPPVVALLEQTARGRERLGRHFRAALGLNEMLWDFQDSRRRLTLLTAPSLQRLARFLGAALHSAPLARIVTRAERRHVTERIGEDAYAFALRRGRSHALPDAITATALPLAIDPVDRIEVAGWRALLTVLAGEPAAVAARFRLKMPRSLAASSDLAADLDPGAAAATWAFVQPVLRETSNPEELRCFA